MEGVAVGGRGGRFVTSSLDPDGCGASISDPITRMDSCAHPSRPSSWDTSVQKAATGENSAGLSQLLWWQTLLEAQSSNHDYACDPASDPGGMSSFEGLLLF